MFSIIAAPQLHSNSSGKMSEFAGPVSHDHQEIMKIDQFCGSKTKLGSPCPPCNARNQAQGKNVCMYDHCRSEILINAADHPSKGHLFPLQHINSHAFSLNNDIHSHARRRSKTDCGGSGFVSKHGVHSLPPSSSSQKGGSNSQSASFGEQQSTLAPCIRPVDIGVLDGHARWIRHSPYPSLYSHSKSFSCSNITGDTDSISSSPNVCYHQRGKHNIQETMASASQARANHQLKKDLKKWSWKSVVSGLTKKALRLIYWAHHNKHHGSTYHCNKGNHAHTTCTNQHRGRLRQLQSLPGTASTLTRRHHDDEDGSEPYIDFFLVNGEEGVELMKIRRPKGQMIKTTSKSFNTTTPLNKSPETPSSGKSDVHALPINHEKGPHHHHHCLIKSALRPLSSKSTALTIKQEKNPRHHVCLSKSSVKPLSSKINVLPIKHDKRAHHHHHHHRSCVDGSADPPCRMAGSTLSLISSSSSSIMSSSRSRRFNLTGGIGTRSDATASCPASTRSSPRHNYLYRTASALSSPATVHCLSSYSNYNKSGNSNFSQYLDLHSAVQGAIAHCKQSHTILHS